MKKTTKAFTLVEMLIVIVIIGILIASLMPRMQSAQGRARDVARKNDLSQIQTAIITSQQDRGVYPGMSGNDATGNIAASGINVNIIEKALTKAGMSSVPTDPNGSNLTYGLGNVDDATKASSATTGALGKYLYLVAKRNGVANAGFVLMAKTEVEGSSNWVVCDSGTKNNDAGYITGGTDLKNIVTCSTITETGGTCRSNTGACFYTNTSELRYIVLN